jgi:hypothetical protein
LRVGLDINGIELRMEVISGRYMTWQPAACGSELFPCFK